MRDCGDAVHVVDTGASAITDENRCVLAAEVYETVYNHTETFCSDDEERYPVGVGLAYLLGGIVSNKKMSFGHDSWRDFTDVLHDAFEKDHKVWLFVDNKVE